jgi:hypothetical protein
MTSPQELEGRKAASVILDMVEAVQRDDQERLGSVAQAYIDTASSHDEQMRLMGMLLLLFAQTVSQLTSVLGKIQPQALEQWRAGMQKIAAQG